MPEIRADDRARRLRRASAGAAVALVYVAGASLVAKLHRVVDLVERSGDTRPLWLLPLLPWSDLALAAACAGIAFSLAARLPRRTASALLLLLLLPIALLLPVDVLSHRLIGTSITWSHLMGWEGATPADLDLLETSDLLFLVGGLVASLTLLGLVAWAAPRWDPLVRRARPLTLTLLLGVALGLTGLQRTFLPRDYGLAAAPLVTLASSAFDLATARARATRRASWGSLLRTGESDPTPLPAPALSGPRARNLVLFLAEAIPYKHTSFADPDADPTPHLRERQARHGVVFDRYHANWHNSMQALFTISCSQWPPLRASIVRWNPRIDCGSLSETLARQGFAVGLFHGGRFSFYSKLSFFARRGFTIQRDAEDLSRDGRWEMHKWGIDDRAVVEATLAWIDSLPPGQRFAAVLIPITAHYPYHVPRGVRRRFQERSESQRFRNAVAFQDQVFESLIRGLEERNLYRETALFWLGDHGHSVDEPLRTTASRRTYYQPDLHTPLVVIAPSLFPESLPADERRSERIGGHLDLAPTALDALGLPPDPSNLGQSLFARRFEPRRAFFAAESGGAVGFVDGRHKFVYDLVTEEVEYYDLARDPLELEDISARHPDRMARYAEVVRAFAGTVADYHDHAPRLVEEVGIANLYEAAIDAMRATVDGEPCTRSPGVDEIECPGLERPIRIGSIQLRGLDRRCLLVPMPASGSVEIEITRPDLLDLVSGAQVLLTHEERGHGVVGRVHVDGALHAETSARASADNRLEFPRARESLVLELVRPPRRRGAADVEVCLDLVDYGLQPAP